MIKKIFFALVISPVFVWMIIHPKELFSEWIKIPEYSKTNISSLLSPDKIMKVDTERWNAFGPRREEFISKVYYNKGTVLLDDFFSLTTYFSPRLYFQSGDGTNFSPNRVEPIAIPLFVFWIMGIVELIKNKKYKLFIAAFLFGIFAYFAGQRNFAFLFPVAGIYTWISIYGIELLKKIQTKNKVYVFLGLYGLYLFGRLFLLK